jgi:hypothetical protein
MSELSRAFHAWISRAYRRFKVRRQFRVSLGNGLSEVDAFYNPKRRHAIELTQEQILKREEDDEGDGDEGSDAAADDGGPESPVRKLSR